MPSLQGEERREVNGGRPRTLTILGCGALGTAILSGIVGSRRTGPEKASASSALSNGTSHGSPQEPFPSRFLACVRREVAAEAIKTKLAREVTEGSVSVLVCQNTHAARQADVVLIACQPHELLPLIDEPGMREALTGKLLISVLAGITTTQIVSYLQQGSTEDAEYFVIKTMPNTACFVQGSATVVERPHKSVPRSLVNLTEDIFRCVGQVFHTDEARMDTCTALCGSTPAFFAVVVDALADGAVALGLNRREAELMAAHAMRGTADLIIGGQQPHNVRSDVASPGGSTMAGLLTLEEGRTRSIFANALRMSTLGATRLGSHGSVDP